MKSDSLADETGRLINLVIQEKSLCAAHKSFYLKLPLYPSLLDIKIWKKPNKRPFCPEILKVLLEYWFVECILLFSVYSYISQTQASAYWTLII